MTAADARRAASGLGGADGDSIAISTVKPTKPRSTAPAPNHNKVLTDMPRRPDRARVAERREHGVGARAAVGRLVVVAVIGGTAAKGIEN